MKISRTILIIGIILSLISCSKQHSIPTIGEKISDYEFSDIINGESTSIKKLNGKPIILEFWATWCGPCISAVKKLDSLQTKYQDKIEMLSISSDKRDRLEQFINNTNLNLRVAYDTIHQKTFPYKVIPHSILVDSKGIIKAITSPTNITEQTIIDLIDGKPLALVEKNDFVTDTSNVVILKEIRDPEKNLILTGFNPTEVASSKINWSPDGIVTGFECHNLTLPSIFQNIYEIRSQSRVKFKDSLSNEDFQYIPENLYNLTIEVSENLEDRVYEIGKEFLNSNFDINARKVIDTVQTYILLKTEDVLKESKTQNPVQFFRGPRYVGKKLGLNHLGGYLENHIGMPIVDKTNLKGLYDIELNWQYEDKSTLYSELKKYGLELRKAEELLPVEVLEIYKKE